MNNKQLSNQSHQKKSTNTKEVERLGLGQNVGMNFCIRKPVRIKMQIFNSNECKICFVSAPGLVPYSSFAGLNLPK